MANVLFKRGNTNTINGTAITDGQLLYNTTTGQHYIDSDLTRKEVGKPVVNTTAEVSAITVDNISCGTKPVKELITSLNAIGTVKTLLATATTEGATVTNSDSISNYKNILIELKLVVEGINVVTRRLIPTCAITIGEIEDIIGFYGFYGAGTYYHFQITFSSTIHTRFAWGVSDDITITSIKMYGIN